MNPQDASPYFIVKNKSGTQPGEIHIWEFPHEGFYVQLKPEIMEELVNHAAENVGGIAHLVSVLKVRLSTVYRYRGQQIFIPLSTVLHLCELTGTDIMKLEPHVKAYKSGSNAQPIRKPNLPLRETPTLFALMGHLMGDGGHSRRDAYYYNTNESLITEFLSQLRVVFGDVPVRVTVSKRKRKAHWKPVTRIRFGMTIVRLLRHLYHVDVRTFTARVPHRLFDLPREFAAAFLQAFGDDEGRVHDDQIELCSANRELLRDVYDLVQTKFPELGEFAVFKKEHQNNNPSRNDLYHIRFRTGAFKSYRTLIGFTHSEKKKELDRILGRRERGWHCKNKGETRRMLLKGLKSGPMTAKELARSLDVKVSAIHYHIKDLVTLRFVLPTGKAGRAGQVYVLTGAGQKFLELPPLGLEFLALARSGVQKKLAILKTLAHADEGLVFRELMHQLRLKRDTIRHHLMPRGRKGRTSEPLGLLELGLAMRSRNEGQSTAYVYSLTQEGRRVLEELETHFPELFNSA